MNRLFTFLKKNYGYILLICTGIFFIALFQSLYLGSSDDRIYSTIARASLPDIFYFMRYHYIGCNGRTIIHLVLIAVLYFGVYAWRVLCPLLLCLILFLMAKLLSKDKCSMQSALMWSVLSALCIGAQIYDQTLFWAPGSVNYILPAAFLLLLFLQIRTNRCPAILPFLAFLCGATTEQFGMITVGGLVLYAFKRRFADKEKVSAAYIISIVTAVAGVLTVLLSPSVSARTYEEVSSFSDKFNFLVFGIWFNGTGMQTLLLLLSLAVCIYFACITHDKTKHLIVTAYAASLFGTMLLKGAKIPIISVLCVYAFPLLLISGMFAASACCIRKAKNYLPLFSLLLGGGAQFMMLFTQRIAMRTTMPSVFCFMTFAVLLLAAAESGHKRAIVRILCGAAIVCLSCIAVWNISGYVHYAEAENEKYQRGEMYTYYSKETTDRADVDRIIQEFEDVRLEQIKLHAEKAAK